MFQPVHPKYGRSGCQLASTKRESVDVVPCAYLMATTGSAGNGEALHTRRTNSNTLPPSSAGLVASV